MHNCSFVNTSYRDRELSRCLPVSHVFVSSCCSRFGQSNSLPTAGCVGGSVSARRSLRQFQMPSRSLPGARLGLLGSGGLLGPTPRSSSSTPTGPKQGRQVSQTSSTFQPTGLSANVSPYFLGMMSLFSVQRVLLVISIYVLHILIWEIMQYYC